MLQRIDRLLAALKLIYIIVYLNQISDLYIKNFMTKYTQKEGTGHYLDLEFLGQGVIYASKYDVLLALCE